MLYDSNASMTISTASSVLSSRPSYPLNRYMLPLTSTTSLMDLRTLDEWPNYDIVRHTVTYHSNKKKPLGLSLLFSYRLLSHQSDHLLAMCA